jgi:hypothetical protein
MKLRLFLILSLLFFFTAGGVSQPSGFEFNSNRSHVTIPIEVSHNLVVITLRINHSPPMNFILDTGVKTTILTEPLVANLLELDLSERIYIFGLGGEGIVEAARVSGVDLHLDGITGHDMDLIVLPEGILTFSEMFGFPVFGIIGYDLFKEFPIAINYTAQQARIYREPNYRIRRRSQVVPFQLVDGKPYTSTRLIGHNGDTLTTNLLIDLGASHPVYLNKDHIDLAPETLEGFLGKGISGSLMGRIGRIDHLLFNDLPVKEPLVAFPDKEFLSIMGQQLDWQGIIGGGILSRFDLIIDYPSEQMVIRPNFRFRKPFTFNLSGLEVIADGPNYKKYMIHYVRPNSPAYEAGVQTGDQILAINFRSYQNITLNDIQDELAGAESNVISLVLLRGDEVFRARFRLRSDI